MKHLDNLDDPVEPDDDISASPNPANRYLKDEILFSPSFGGEKSMDNADDESEEVKKKGKV